MVCLDAAESLLHDRSQFFLFLFLKLAGLLNWQQVCVTDRNSGIGASLSPCCLLWRGIISIVPLLRRAYFGSRRLFLTKVRELWRFPLQRVPNALQNRTRWSFGICSEEEKARQMGSPAPWSLDHGVWSDRKTKEKQQHLFWLHRGCAWRENSNTEALLIM